MFDAIKKLFSGRNPQERAGRQTINTCPDCGVQNGSLHELFCTCVRALIDAGADPNARSEEGITPLINAAWFGCYDSVRELLRRGADPQLFDRKGRTARDVASERGHVDVMKLLK